MRSFAICKCFSLYINIGVRVIAIFFSCDYLMCSVLLIRVTALFMGSGTESFSFGKTLYNFCAVAGSFFFSSKLYGFGKILYKFCAVIGSYFFSSLLTNGYWVVGHFIVYT